MRESRVRTPAWVLDFPWKRGGGRRSVWPLGSTKTREARVISTVARFLRFSGMELTRPSLRASQNLAMGQSRHRGERGVQRVAPNSIMAWFQSPGEVRVEKSVGDLLELRPAAAGAEIAVNGSEASEDASDVTIENGKFFFVGNAENGGSGVGTDAGEGESFFFCLWKDPTMIRDDFLSGFLKISRARIVAESRPEAKNFFLRGFRERLHGGGSERKAFVIGDDGSDAGLLEHDFGEPDVIGIFVAAPREVALELREPGEEIFAKA